MFENGFILTLIHCLLYVILPIFPGILFIFIFFDIKFKGIILYILSWFFGIGIISSFIYIVQMFYFGINKGLYFILLLILLSFFLIKLYFKKINISVFINTLKIENSFQVFKKSFYKLSGFRKILTITLSVYVFLFSLLGFLYNTSFPTYFDDSFGNWEQGSINMYFDDGYEVFGEENEILGKGGRINYPIHISIFKALIADFAGFWYELYQNLFQYFSFLFLIIFIFKISFDKTQNLFLSILPGFLLTSISLVFFHIVDGYFDITCGIYSVFVIYFLYNFLETKNYEYFIGGLLFGFLLINIKNDAFVVYFPGIIFGFLLYLFITKNIKIFMKGLLNKLNIIKISLITFIFLLPPFFIRFYHGLALNPQSNDGFINEKLVHFEIFKYFDDIFINENNYGLILLLLPLIFFKSNKNKGSIKFILYSFLFIFSIFILVFLLTSNFRWVLDQTTVNRTFMSAFVILFSYFSFFYHD